MQQTRAPLSLPSDTGTANLDKGLAAAGLSGFPLGLPGKAPRGCQDLSCGWGCTSAVQEASLAPVRTTWLQGLGSLCASVAAPVTSHPGLHAPQESSLGFKTAVQGTWCREYANSGNVVRFVGFFCESCLRIFFGSCCHCSFGVEEAFLRGLECIKQVFRHISCLAFSWLSFFLETALSQGQRVCSLGKGRSTRATCVGRSKRALLLGGTLSPAEQSPAANTGSAELNSSVMPKHLRL